MKKNDVIRAWRDQDYYLSLTDEERAQLPAHPAGLVELADENLDGVAGGTGWSAQLGGSASCTPCPPRHCF